MAEQNKVIPESGYVYINVVGQENVVVVFRITRHTPMRELMTQYCERLGLCRHTLRFRYDGLPVNENDTMTTLELVDNNTIEAYQRQKGGRN